MNYSYKSHHLAALICGVVGYSGMAKFPGESGWIGFLGCICMATCFLLDPGLAVNSKLGKLRYPRATPIAVAFSLIIVVASVVIWSIDR